MAYIKARMKVILWGFLIGLLAGSVRVHFFAPPDIILSARIFLILQIALAFSALALFISNYLELRRRVFQRVKNSD